MNTTMKAKHRILSLALALCLLLAMTLHLPGPVTVSASMQLGTDADLTPDPDGTGLVPGNQVYFGEYAGSPILWRVLENSGGDALLLSENILHTMPFKDNINVWAESSIREYLNTELLDKFPAILRETGGIVDTDTTITGYETTTDKLYLLSVEEANAMQPADLNIGVYWWLRSPGTTLNYAAVVDSGGLVNWIGSSLNYDYGIRPAFRLDQSSAIFTSGGDGSVGTPWVVGGNTQQLLSLNDYLRINVEGLGNRDWKVIKIENNYATLLCMTSLEGRAFNVKPIWALSDARAFLNPETDWDYAATTFSFTGGEQRAITLQTITEGGIPSQDRLFLLSMDEASYFANQGARASTGRWWLRTPGGNAQHVAVVGSDGVINPSPSDTLVYNDSGIRPAFRLDLSSVLFTSAAAGGKSAAGGNALEQVVSPAGAVKLTLKDDVNLSLTVTDNSPIDALNGDTVDIAYTGAKTGSDRSVSVVIANGTGKPLFYGRPVDTSSGNANGTASFQLPTAADLPPGTYKLLMFNEEVNGANLSDYASTPVDIPLNVGAPDTTKPTVTAVTPSGSGVSVGTSSLSITFSEDMHTGVTGTVSLDNGATVANGQWQADDRTILYDLSGLDYATTYTVTISDFQDISSNVMDLDSSHDFTTQAESPITVILELDALEDDAVEEGQNYSKTVGVTYTGSLPLGYSTTSILPNGVSISGNTISGAPTATGSYPITVTVSEQGGSLTASESYTLTVDPPSASPTQLSIATPANLTVTEGEAFTKTFSVTYVGNGSLTYDIDGLPDGVTYSSTTGVISGSADPGTAENSPYTVTVGVTDNSGNNANSSFTLTVLPASSSNDAHTITATAGYGGGISPSGSVTVNDGGSQFFTITADPDYQIADVLVDDDSIGAVSGYTFTNVTGNHTIHATFAKANTGEEDGGNTGGGNTGGVTTGSVTTRSDRDRSSGGSSYTPPPKTQLPASAFSWDGERTLTIDHDGITPLGLLNVRWDGVETTAYSKYSGSVIVRFDQDFIDSQSAGDHTVRVEFLNHTGEITVTVGGEPALSTVEPNDDLFLGDTHNPNTGGGRGIWPALLLGGLGAAAMVKLRPRLKLKG